MTRLPRGSKVIDQQAVRRSNGKVEGVQVFDLPPDPRKRYPVWRIDALEADIRNAQDRIDGFQQAINDQAKLIEERREQIEVCKERDRAIAEWERDRANSDFPSGNEADPGSGS